MWDLAIAIEKISGESVTFINTLPEYPYHQKENGEDYSEKKTSVEVIKKQIK